MRRERKIDKNVEQIINEMRNARKLSEKGKKKKKLFKNKSDSLLDYSEEQRHILTLTCSAKVVG